MGGGVSWETQFSHKKGSIVSFDSDLFKIYVLSVADPGSCAYFWPLDPGSGMGKNQDPDLTSGMNIPDHKSESLKTIFDLNSLMQIRIRDPKSFWP